jgi:hypothetical protein
MQVEDIAKAGCDPINLTATISTIRNIVTEAAKKTRKQYALLLGCLGRVRP